MSTNTKLAEPVNAVAVLRNVLNTLKHENSKPDGSISDTIWYSAYETLFDYVESSLEAIAAHDAEQAQPMFPKCASGTSEQAAQAVPAGFKWVPVEPTEDMLTAAGREDDKAFVDGMPHGATAADVWAVMLSAAPAAPAPEAQQAAGQAQDERAAFEAWARTYSTLPITHDAMFPHSYEDMGQAMLWDAWQARAALAQRREPLTDEDWRTRDSSDTDEGCAALHRAHGIGATTGEQR